MQIIGGYQEAIRKVPPLVYAIGNFDGVHLGHVALIKEAGRLAKENNVPCGVYTFWPHPRVVLSHQNVELICTREQKMKRFEEEGVEFVIEEPFTHDFSMMTGQQFCERVIAQALRAKAVVTGPNFHFGHGATGSPEKMAQWLKPFGIKHDLVPPVIVGDKLSSSSAIRVAVKSGNVEEATAMLGRPFSVIGTIVKGDGRGRTIGVPTANLDSESTLMPAPGVYATRVRVDGSQYAAATNVGTRPTFSRSHKVHIESHLLKFNEDIYGKKIEVSFVRKIRDEKKFASGDELKAQIAQDLKEVTLVMSA